MLLICLLFAFALAGDVFDEVSVEVEGILKSGGVMLIVAGLDGMQC